MANWCDNYIQIGKRVQKKHFYGIKKIIKKMDNRNDVVVFMLENISWKQRQVKICLTSRWIAPKELLEELWHYLEPLGYEMCCYSYEPGCDLFEEFYNGSVEALDYTNVSNEFLKCFGDNLIEENLARICSNVLPEKALTLIASEGDIRWSIVKDAAMEYDWWDCMDDTVKAKIERMCHLSIK